MIDTFEITIGKHKYQVSKGITLEEIASQFQGKYKYPILLAKVNNILKELNNDLGIVRSGNELTDWAKQGVLLLNSVLTVVKDTPLSHKGKGWEIFTDNIIRYLNDRNEPIVFILWGSYARSKKELITNKKHFIIESAHPSPLSASRGFFGSRPFSRANDFLVKNGISPIKW